jgi:hypothetical protein
MTVVSNETLTGAHRCWTCGLWIVPEAVGVRAAWEADPLLLGGSQNRLLRRGGGLSACMLRVVSLGAATFATMCSRKLLKTSSAASETPTPTDCVCVAFSISCSCVGSVMDCKCVPILRRNLSLLQDLELGFLTAAPVYTDVFMVFM